MNFDIIASMLYMLSVALFIFGLKMLSSPATARRGNMLSALGMLVAIVVTAVSVIKLDMMWTIIWVVVGMAIGSIIGGVAAKLVSMTAMPEMVALFNGFGGIASLIVGLAEYHRGIQSSGDISLYSAVVISLAVMIGGVTFTGSLIAWGKLSGVMNQKAVSLPGQNILSAVVLILAIVFAVVFYMNPLSFWWALYLVVFISLLLGILAVIAIGGGDMPVVISLLNSYSGLAAAAAGFVIMNTMLIVAGALVGASGIILTVIMCKAMNRSLVNVLFSAFGSTLEAVGSKDQEGEVKPLNPADAYIILEAAQSVAFVPGYGMAVAQAQHVVKELSELLEDNGAEVYFAVHPVAGRMPGHMNVLLAEADVSYDKLYEMDNINPIMASIDVAVVIGANDVVNPAARHDEASPIYGMPIINVDEAKTVFVLKRSMAAGFAGVQNELFYYPNTRMVFGDAKETIQSIVAEFKS